MNQEVQKKDFLIELAKSIDILDNCGLDKKEIKIEMSLCPEDFDRLISRLSKITIIYGDIPTQNFKINFSGVQVTFKKNAS